jgi:hypothetical protein
MSDCTTKNVFGEWMTPFIDKDESVTPQPSEEQLDLFADLE